MIKLENFDNVEAPSVDYPYGSIKNDDGTLNGTPLNREVLGDMFQFFAKLFDASGLVASDTPDQNGNFQLFTALQNNVTKKFVREIETPFDNEVYTIDRNDIVDAFDQANPFYSGTMDIGGTTPEPFFDFQVQIWCYEFITSSTWSLVPLQNIGDGSGTTVFCQVTINDGGDITISFRGTVFPSDKRCRIIILG